MRKITCLVLLLVAIASVATAQSKDEKLYKQRALEVQDEVWGAASKPFAVTAIPDQFKNESAVIIAKFFEVTNSAKTRYKFGLFGGGFTKRFKYYTTLREKVKINDKAALEEFSTLEYKKNLNNTSRMMLRKIIDTYKTFVGAKIKKPDGKEIIVNVDEEVLTKDEAKDKEGKLAIPGLQVGDILDYYVRIEEVTEAGADARGPNYFFLTGEYPIMNYNVRYILDERCGADVLNINGAKPMVQSRTDDGDMLLEFNESNLPKSKSTLWSSDVRQFPYYAVRYIFVIGGYGMPHFAQGRVNRGPLTSEYLHTIKDYFKNVQVYRQIDYSAEKAMEEHFGGSKKTKAMPADSIINYLYTYNRWYNYGGIGYDDINVNNEYYNYSGWQMFKVAVSLNEILNDYDIDNDIILVSSRYSNRLSDAVVPGDFECLIRINNGGKTSFLGLSDFFTLTGELPAAYQGEEAIALKREGKKKRPDYDDSKTSLPVTKSSENIATEILNVSFTPGNIQLLNIERTCGFTGSMKQSAQKYMLLLEDVDYALSKEIGKMTWMERYQDNKKLRSRSSELKNAYDKERQKVKSYFEGEIKNQFDQEAKEVTKFEILKNGLTLASPVFEFKAVFTMDNFVKKAGANYIFEVGKLMGTYKKIEEKDRERGFDVYMPSARVLQYTFNIELPQGYKANGVEQLNKTVTTDAATFISTAKQNGNTITVTATRTYNNNFEKAANWPKLLQVMDAAADFTAQKLLLQKQ